MQNINNKNGYTIIETMIATSLFLVVVTIGVGSLINANLVHQRSGDMRSILDSLSFVMEDMSRNLRTGYQYYCAPPSDNLNNVNTALSGNNCWAIAFEGAEGGTSPNDQWVYFIDSDGKLFKSIQGPYHTFPSNYVQLTPDEIVLESGSGFTVEGAEPPPGDTLQPFVTIKLIGNITYKNITTPFSLQTSISQRLIDI